MSFEDQPDFARQVADLNKYGQALNRCESVEEVVSLTIEAMSLLFDISYSTIVEERDGDLTVVHSTNPDLSAGDEPSEVAREAFETGETVTATGEAARTGEDTEVTAALAAPARIVDDVTAVLVTRTKNDREFDDAHVRPMEILASHAATAISNIRSRERLERARQDLETRKEMIEMYDRLLRHDLGNDLQVIAGFSDALVSDLDGQTRDHAERIQRAARSSADLIERVGDLVSTLESQDEPEPRDLAALIEETVRDVDSQYASLTVEFDPSAFAYSVYGGDLLDSVFTNVLSNAAVHNEGDVTVHLSAETTGRDAIVVRFADDGSGVPAEVRDEIFEMGVKGPESGGTGFGLGLVRALTESYGGSVTVGDSEYGGAEFRVRLERA
ncbi:MAG: ATP-binding protein [Haloarculaceae archaeon]